MPKGSGLTNRSVVNHGQNGKGDASRVTDERAYRENFEKINWRTKKVKTPVETDHDFMMGLCI